MKIKNYNEFTGDNVLYIFDFDDTLVNSPSFEELAINYLKEDITIKDLLNQSINRVGVTLDDLKWQDGRIYVLDPNKELKEFGNWVRKGDRLYMFTPNAFHLSDLSLPETLKELSELYKSVENKCIVTAREESLRDKRTGKGADDVKEKLLADAGLYGRKVKNEDVMKSLFTLIDEVNKGVPTEVLEKRLQECRTDGKASAHEIMSATMTSTGVPVLPEV